MTSHIRREEIKVTYYKGDGQWTNEYGERKVFNTTVDATTEMNLKKIVGLIKENEGKIE